KIGIFLLVAVMWNLWRTEPANAERATRTSRLASQGGRMALVAAGIAIPLVFYVFHDFHTYSKRLSDDNGLGSTSISQIVGPGMNIPKYFWYQVVHSFGAFNIFPDVTGFYLPGVPLLIGLSSPLFLIGILFALYKRQLLPVLWVLLVTVF